VLLNEKSNKMKLDHIAINAVNLEIELEFLTDFIGLSLLQKWPDLRQAYVGFNSGPVIGVIENKDFDGSVYTKAHLAFNVTKAEFDEWIDKIKRANIEIFAGPKAQRSGETILFRTPSKNIIELCYPYVRETIADQIY
jgi:catechol 2,3-dioxygenase-like lactoylglutathione lyase family enzyme